MLWFGSGLQPCDRDHGCSSFSPSVRERDHMDSVMRQFNMAATDPAASCNFLIKVTFFSLVMFSDLLDARDMDTGEERLPPPLKQGFCVYPQLLMWEKMRK